MIAELANRMVTRSGWGGLWGLGLASIYACKIEPTWLKVQPVTLPVRRLPAAFEGFTIAHLSDLHYSDIVPLEHLRNAVRLANLSKPDLIVLTGDYITRGDEWVEGVAEVVAGFQAPAGVLATLGNHDYHGGRAKHWDNGAIAGHIEESFTRGGLTVLRNAATEIRRDGQSLQIVGLDDLWSGRFDPAKAFADVAADRPVVALSHNPDTMDELAARSADVVLSGHTHGGQVNLPGYGPPIRACKNRALTCGLYRFGDSRLYINPGIGYLRKVRFNCRPEITLIKLTAAGGEPRA